MKASKMCHLRHRLRFFLFRRKVSFRSQDIQVFVFLTVPWFPKSVTSWWVLVDEAGCIFECVLNHKSLTHQTRWINRYKKGQYFSKIFWTIWWTGSKFQTLFILATCSNFSIANYVKFPVFHFVEGVNKGELTMVYKYQLIKNDKSRYIVISLKS